MSNAVRFAGLVHKFQVSSLVLAALRSSKSRMKPLNMPVFLVFLLCKFLDQVTDTLVGSY